MRTISQVAAWMREADPASALTESALRRMVVAGKLPTVRVGKKYLLDLDQLEQNLFADEMEAPTGGKIRAVEVKGW